MAATSTTRRRAACRARPPPGCSPRSDILGGPASGRTAVSAGPGAPLLLRCGDELLALDAADTVLVRPDGSRSVVRDDRAALPAAEGVHRLETPTCEVVALCA
ncbi:MAG: hypothetical protein ACRDP3_00205 [Streptomyces sp.]|uniref:hypothetical protein n=1 Tax=Streptomyces sp. TaxID=1931 RepID=UPI003D6B5B83